LADFKESFSEVIIRTLKDNLGDVMRAYFNGDPVQIAQSLLPCIIVEKENLTVEVGPTGTDERAHRINVKVVFNKKDDFGKMPDEANTQRRLEDFTEGLNETTGEYDDHTVLGVLRRNFTLGNLVNNQIVNVDYGVTPRPQDVLTAEANIIVTISDILTVSNRT